MLPAPATKRETWVTLKSRKGKLCKVFKGDKVQGYSLAKWFIPGEVSADNLAEWFQVLQALSLDPSRCLIRGRFFYQFLADFSTSFSGEDRPPVGHVPRCRQAFPDCPQHLVAFDVDQFIPPAGVSTISLEAVRAWERAHLPAQFWGVSGIVQWTASAGMGDRLKARVWYWLNTPQTSDALLAWSRGMEGFDRVVFRPVQIHYTASPEFEDGATDPLAGQDRVIWMQGEQDAVDLHIDPLLMLVSSQRYASTPTPPADKLGIVGAFCRAYPLDALLAPDGFLAGVFESDTTRGDDMTPSDGGGKRRLTYCLGGGAAGGAFITEDGQRIVNMHNTDPLENRAANAWDLVRVYKFGHLDFDDSVDIWRSPSQKAMIDEFENDEKVLFELANEGLLRQKELTEAFGNQPKNLELDEVSLSADAVPPPPPPPTDISEPLSPDFSAQVARVRQTLPKGNRLGVADMENILCADPSIRGKIWFNKLTESYDCQPDVPWRHGRTGTLDDADVAGMAGYLQRVYGKLVAITTVWSGIERLRDIAARNPVADWLDSLVWDGIARLNTLLHDVAGCPNDAYHAAVLRKTLCAVVTRQYRPGAKFDTVLIFVGKPGIKKSTFFKHIAPLGAFAENPPDMTDSVRFAGWARGNVLCEMSELSAMSVADVENVKSLLSTTVDRYRGAYERQTKDRPRQFVLVGTSNTMQIDRDDTGGLARRIWPVMIHRDIDLAGVDVAQVWAEAVALVKAGEPLHLEPGSPEALQADQMQRAAVDDDNGGAAALAEWLDREKIMATCARQIWADYYHLPEIELTRAHSRRINRLLRALGWREHEARFGRFGHQRGWQRQQ